MAFTFTHKYILIYCHAVVKHFFQSRVDRGASLAPSGFQGSCVAEREVLRAG